MPTSFLQAWTLVAALLSITKAQGINGNYSAIIDDNIEDYDRDLYQYIKQNLPLRNGTEYPLRYTGFNWTEPAEDNGLWTLRWNTADAWLPGNLTKPGREKAVVTSYALQWQGEDKYNNLSAKIANDTDALRDAAIRQSPPNMCFGMMSWSSDFPEEVKKRMDVDASNGCESLFGEECLRSLTRAYTIAFDDDDCDIAVDEPRSTGLAGCADTWDKLGGLTFLSTSIANGSQASNTSYKSPEWDDVIAQQVQLHAADDNSTYEKELERTQFVVLKESGKDAQLLCKRFEGSAWRVAAGLGPVLLTIGVLTAQLMEVL